MIEILQILIVEDNPVDAQLLVRELQRTGFQFEWQRVDTEAEYLAKLNSNLHLILSDYAMPQFSGLRALELLKQRSDLDIPFIIISGTIGEETAVTAIREGASDYLLKDRTARLGPAIQRARQEVEQRRERLRLEAQFLEAQKMEVLGHLAGGVAHDFNNVLAVIMGYSDLVVQELAPDDSLQAYVEEIRTASKRAAGLTQQLLIFSRKQTVESVLLNLNEHVQEMEKMLKQLINENIEMTMLYDEHVGCIKADPGYVWQVLMNLVVNARDAMPNGGKLVIKTGEVNLDKTFVETRDGMAPGCYVMLSVSDTGVGMSDEVKARLFEAFFTTKEKGKGTGLGLVTCQTIVRQVGGYIDILSEVNEGTIFNVYFPRFEQLCPAKEAPKPKADSLRQGEETLLIVEDDPSLRHLAEGVLKAQGYVVLTAPNGQDALRMAREHQGEPIRLVVTDVIMPLMDGKVMAEWMKTFYPDLKILFTSGYTEDAIAHHGVLDEKVEFLPKPYSPASLSKKVRKLLDT